VLPATQTQAELFPPLNAGVSVSKSVALKRAKGRLAKADLPFLCIVVGKEDRTGAIR